MTLVLFQNGSVELFPRLGHRFTVFKNSFGTSGWLASWYFGVPISDFGVRYHWYIEIPGPPLRYDTSCSE